MEELLKLILMVLLLNNKYILKLLELWKNPLRKTKKGAAIPHLNKQLFYNIIVGIPPIKEQSRIVERVDYLFQLRE